MSALGIIKIVLSLLSTFVQWGQRTKMFSEDESIIALTLLANAQKDMDIAKTIRADAATNPNSVHDDTEFRRD